MEEGFNYWYEKSRQNQYWDHEANEQGNLLHAYAATIKEELSQNTNIKICCNNECLHDLSKSNSQSPTSPNQKNQDNQLTDKEKSQLLSLFQKYNIKKLTLGNDKLVIEYNNSQTENKEIDKQELEKYRKLIQKLPNHSISLSNLQTNSNKNPNNNNLAIGLVTSAGIVFFSGIVAYFLLRKKKVK
jgi:hypothetical protein